MKLTGILSDYANQFKVYWNKPPLGRYMTFKEIFSLSIGGMGIKFICYAVQLMILSVGNTLIGNTIGIDPQPMYVIYLLSVVASFPLTALRAKIIDNTRNKKGKYRPFIFTMGIPTVILAMGFTWMPYEKMDLLTKCAVVLAFNVGFQFFYMFMFDSYNSILNVLSPNTYERSDVNSIKSVTDSFAPTIVGAVLPLLARWITGENTLFDMRIYRVVFPPILLVGLGLSIFIYTNTEEKIVQAKTHVIGVKFWDAFRAVAKNKYFWIISLAGWLGFLEVSFANILSWLYNYQDACTAGQYSIVTMVYGNSALWSMLFAPMLIRKIGKRNLLISSNIMSIFFILLMYPVIVYAPAKNIMWLILGCMFINGIVTSLGNVLIPSLNGDIRDYQQYRSGERIEGMFFTVGLIGSVVTMATSSVLPAIYDAAGLNSTVAQSLGYDGSNVYDVLYNTEYFNQISGVLIIASAIGAVLNVIPFFFYDLTETKQKAMVTVLKIRALFEDYGNEAVSDENLVEAIDMIDEAKEYVNRSHVPSRKRDFKTEGLTKKEVKLACKEAKEINQKIEIAQFVVDEVDKFDTPFMQQQVDSAREIRAAGLERYLQVKHLTVKEAKGLPASTKKEKEQKKLALEKARAFAYARRTGQKYYPNGIVKFDRSIFDKLFSAEDQLEESIKAAHNMWSQAKTEKNRSKMQEARGQLKELRGKKTQVQQNLKQATNLFSIYNRAAKPYLDAKNLLLQKENYQRCDEIAEKYEESKVRAQQAMEEKLAQEKREKKEKEAYAAKLKEEKKAAKMKK